MKYVYYILTSFESYSYLIFTVLHIKLQDTYYILYLLKLVHFKICALLALYHVLRLLLRFDFIFVNVITCKKCIQQRIGTSNTYTIIMNGITTMCVRYSIQCKIEFVKLYFFDFITVQNFHSFATYCRIFVSR